MSFMKLSFLTVVYAAVAIQARTMPQKSSADVARQDAALTLRSLLQAQQQVWSGVPAPTTGASAFASASATGATTTALSMAAASSSAQPGTNYKPNLGSLKLSPSSSSSSSSLPMAASSAPSSPSAAAPADSYDDGSMQPSAGAGAGSAGSNNNNYPYSSASSAPAYPSAADESAITPYEASSSDPAASGGATAGPADGTMAAILALHNKLRARHAAPALAWDAGLAAGAQRWADGCVFAHSGAGENLAQYFPDPLAAVQAWYDEVSMYSFSAGQYSSATGHFSQMVWASSARLGCGWAPGCQLLVCHYDPPGNVLGSFQENVSPPVQAA